MSLCPLIKIPNFRQLGSGSVKIYRSSSPDDASQQSVKYLQDELGIQMIIDLRQPGEGSSPAEKKPIDATYKNVTVTEEDIEGMKTIATTGVMLSKDMPYVRCGLGFISRKHNQLLTATLTEAQKQEMSQLKQPEIAKYFMDHLINPRGLAQLYIDFCDTSGTFLFTIFKLLSEPKNVPALIHCTVGKDRTGITSALIQTCVGLSRDKVLEDYAASTEGLKEMYDELYKDYVGKQGMTEEFLSSTKETMATLLEYIDKKYGSVQEYMTNIGFGPEDQEKMKKNILIDTCQQQLA
uniref:putative tyrosine-protein phosphatase H16_A0669 n=1 Tax=Pristiophorus japonicus TaxID=55135 RepID=UPI00398E747F